MALPESQWLVCCTGPINTLRLAEEMATHTKIQNKKTRDKNGHVFLNLFFSLYGDDQRGCTDRLRWEMKKFLPFIGNSHLLFKIVRVA